MKCSTRDGKNEEKNEMDFEQEDTMWTGRSETQ